MFTGPARCRPHLGWEWDLSSEETSALPLGSWGAISSLCCTGAPTEESLDLVDSPGSGVIEAPEKSLAGLQGEDIIPEILQAPDAHSPLQGLSMDPTSHGFSLPPPPSALQSFSLDAQGVPGGPQDCPHHPQSIPDCPESCLHGIVTAIGETLLSELSSEAPH